MLCNYDTWLTAGDDDKYFPLFQPHEYILATKKSPRLNGMIVDTNADVQVWEAVFHAATLGIVICFYVLNQHILMQCLP